MALLPSKVVQQGGPDAMLSALESGLKQMVTIPSPSKPHLMNAMSLNESFLFFVIN